MALWICDSSVIRRLRCARHESTTNAAYGGADRRDLYITESYSATILRAAWMFLASMYSHM
jgi:hypothetical protein